MNLKVVTAPTEEPITLSEAKAHLRVDVADDDALISALIKSARFICEDVARRSFITRTYDLFLDGWWTTEAIKLPLPPLVSVTGIEYTDRNGATSTLNSNRYVVDTAGEPGRIALVYGATFPTTILQPINAIKIRYVAGYGGASAVPDNYKAAIKLVLAHLYENREEVSFQSASKLPLGAESILLMNRGWR
jgi:uncharacterized phiE125 gp8 family phage protein